MPRSSGPCQLTPKSISHSRSSKPYLLINNYLLDIPFGQYQLKISMSKTEFFCNKPVHAPAWVPCFLSYSIFKNWIYLHFLSFPPFPCSHLSSRIERTQDLELTRLEFNLSSSIYLKYQDNDLISLSLSSLIFTKKNNTHVLWKAATKITRGRFCKVPNFGTWNSVNVNSHLTLATFQDLCGRAITSP